MNKLILALPVCALLAICGCAKPEGPAERMGRSIDDLSDSLKGVGESWKEIQEENRKDEDSDDLKSAPKRVVPDHDPYYDTPPSAEYTPQHY